MQHLKYYHQHIRYYVNKKIACIVLLWMWQSLKGSSSFPCHTLLHFKIEGYAQYVVQNGIIWVHSLFQPTKKAFMAAVQPRLTTEHVLKSRSISLYFPPKTHTPLHKLLVRADMLPVLVHYDSNPLLASTPPSSPSPTLSDDSTSPTPNHRPSFQLSTYKDNLHTRVLGNVVMYTQVITTTMALFEG